MIYVIWTVSNTINYVSHIVFIIHIFDFVHVNKILYSNDIGLNKLCLVSFCEIEDAAKASLKTQQNILVHNIVKFYIMV